jgi:hypothetical protein
VSGIIPFGYRLGRDGRTLEPFEDEQRALTVARALRQNGASLREVAQALNANGFTTRAGSPWRFEYVRNLLRQEPAKPPSVAA